MLRPPKLLIPSNPHSTEPCPAQSLMALADSTGPSPMAEWVVQAVSMEPCLAAQAATAILHDPISWVPHQMACITKTMDKYLSLNQITHW